MVSKRKHHHKPAKAVFKPKRLPESWKLNNPNSAHWMYCSYISVSDVQNASAVQLTRKSHCKITDINHLLNFSVSFL
jgi:hypothetical protein